MRWCITQPSTLQLSPVNELTDGAGDVKFYTLFYKKLQESPEAKTVEKGHHNLEALNKWFFRGVSFLFILFFHTVKSGIWNIISFLITSNLVT